jgi:hypothetical protein
MQRLHHYLGLTSDPLAEKCDLIDYDAEFYEACRNERSIAVVAIKYCRMQVGYVFNDYQLAYKWIIKQKEMDSLPVTSEYASVLYLRAAILLEMARSNVNRRKNLCQVRSIIKRFDKLTQETPHNLLDWYHLLKAEMPSLLGSNG